MKSINTLKREIAVTESTLMAAKHTECSYTLHKVAGGYKITNPHNTSDVFPSVEEVIKNRLGIVNLLNRKLLDNPYMFGYVTMETQGTKSIQVLVRKNTAIYRLVDNGVIKKKLRITNNQVSSAIKFTCKSYCSDCGCSRW